MLGAFGKPQGTVTRVHTGQVMMSIHTRLQNKEHVMEALCRTKFKFLGCQNIHISKNWGLAKFNVDEFENVVTEKRLLSNGCGVRYIRHCGLWTNSGPCTCESLRTAPLLMLTSKSCFPVEEKK